MQSHTEDSVRSKMESLRLICDREIPIQHQKIDASAASFRKSLESIKAKAQETVQNQGKLAKMKANLREVEDEFVKVLAVKTRREAKQMATRDSISAIKARLEELKRTVQVQRARRDEYAAFVAQQSQALAASEEKGKEDSERKGEIEEAILWYNRVLGFQIEGGHGVKFTFSNINLKNSIEEYSFTVRHANDTYILLDCDPPLNDTKELIHELNKTNGLFKFVRIMREKFQETAALGFLPQSTTLHQDSSIVSLSAPVLSISTNRIESPAKQNEHEIHDGEVNRHSKKGNYGRRAKPSILSPGSASSLRQSPRLSISTSRSESPAKQNEHEIHDGEVNRPFDKVHGSESPSMKEHQIQYGEVNRHSKKGNFGRGAKPSILSPGSASSLRRSPRFKVKK